MKVTRPPALYQARDVPVVDFFEVVYLAENTTNQNRISYMRQEKYGILYTESYIFVFFGE